MNELRSDALHDPTSSGEYAWYRGVAARTGVCMRFVTVATTAMRDAANSNASWLRGARSAVTRRNAPRAGATDLGGPAPGARREVGYLRNAAMWVVGILTAVAVASFLVLPPIVKHAIETQAPEQLHRQVTVASVAFNPFTMPLSVKGLVFQERIGSEEPIGRDGLFVNVQAECLITLAPVIREICLSRPRILLVRMEEHAFNFSDLGRDFEAKPKPKNSESSIPERSIGGLVRKVIVNLLQKAVTAPIALIGSLFGGGAESSHVDFAPGSAALSANSLQRLSKLVKALADRPALKLAIAGQAASDVDRAGLKKLKFERRIKAENSKMW